MRRVRPEYDPTQSFVGRASSKRRAVSWVSTATAAFRRATTIRLSALLACSQAAKGRQEGQDAGADRGGGGRTREREHGRCWVQFAPALW